MSFQRCKSTEAARGAVFLLTHESSPAVHNLAETLKTTCGMINWTFAVAVDTRCCHQPHFNDCPVWTFTHKELQADGYRLLHSGRWQGVCDIPLLAWAAAHPHEHYWLIEYDVRYSGSWVDFFLRDFGSADLVCHKLALPSDDPKWMWWSSLRSPRSVCRLKTYCPLFRLSNRAVDVLRTARRSDDWGGHAETFLPTVTAAHGLQIASYAPLTTPDSFRYRPPVQPTEGPPLLWHPVKSQK